MRGLTSFLIILATLLVLSGISGAVPSGFAATGLFVVGSTWALLKFSVLCMSAQRNWTQNNSPALTLYPLAQTADKAVDVWVDTREFDEIAFLTFTGAVAGAGLGTPVARHADSSGGSGAEDVPADQLEGAFVATAANQVQKVGYKGTKRFVGISFDYTSGTSVVLGGLIERGRPHQAPTPMFTPNA